MVRVLRSPVDSLSCALFPSSCRLCGSPLLRISRAPICDPCWNDLPLQNGTLCTCCGEDLGVATFSRLSSANNDAFPQAGLFCQPCRLAAPAFLKAVAYGVYQGSLRSLIHLLKYDGILPIADRLGLLLAKSIAEFAPAGAAGACRPQPQPQAAMLVIPVPMHRAKQRERGFHHAELLARTAIAELGRSHPQWRLVLAGKVLERRRMTASQSGLTPHQRRQNLRGAFGVPRPAAVAGRDVLLVDDVYTSGATARACSRVLVAAGAASVQVATVARAQREGVAFWDPQFLRGTAAGQRKPD